jgi:GTPase SAR1 family protein
MKGKAASATDMSPATYKGKVVIIGEYSVGKTSLCQRFINRVVGKTEPTIGAAFQVKTVPLPNSTQTVKLEIWDTAGSERYRSLMPMYYRDAAVAMICYDITNIKSFQRVQVWVDDFRRHAMPDSPSGNLAPAAGRGDDATAPLLLLVGTKADLANGLQETKRQVDADMAATFAQCEGMTFFETSAKTDQNVVEAFMQAAVHIAKTCRAAATSGGDSNSRGAQRQSGSTSSRKVDLRGGGESDDDDMSGTSKKKCSC